MADSGAAQTTVGKYQSQNFPNVSRASPTPTCAYNSKELPHFLLAKNNKKQPVMVNIDLYAQKPEKLLYQQKTT